MSLAKNEEYLIEKCSVFAEYLNSNTLKLTIEYLTTSLTGISIQNSLERNRLNLTLFDVCQLLSSCNFAFRCTQEILDLRKHGFRDESTFALYKALVKTEKKIFEKTASSNNLNDVTSITYAVNFRKQITDEISLGSRVENSFKLYYRSIIPYLAVDLSSEEEKDLIDMMFRATISFPLISEEINKTLSNAILTPKAPRPQAPQPNRNLDQIKTKRNIAIPIILGSIVLIYLVSNILSPWTTKKTQPETKETATLNNKTAGTNMDWSKYESRLSGGKIIDGYTSGLKIHMVGGNNSSKAYAGFILNINKHTEDDLILSGNFSEAFPYYKNLESKGDLTAIHNLGLMYLRGLGVEKNIPEALIYLGKSMESLDNYATAEVYYKKALASSTQ
jgi:hypothetical protein